MLRGRLSACVLALLAALVSSISLPASAEPRGKARPAAARKPAKPAKKAEPDDKSASDTKSAEPASEEKSAPELPDKGEPSGVKPAGTTAATKSQASTGAVVVKESKEGVKTYKFGAIEVEGRSKSPEILYFLRRVRAEFDASSLGHRSFMRELSDTRNRPSFR
jgi:hypothetical protein